jgi:pyruvate formate lyase activating enzyme
MRISGFQKTTLVDYPGKIACSIFVKGCNFRCGFCHNPELINKQGEEFDTESILEEIKSRFYEGWCEGICVSGGEPTLYNELPDFLQRLKKIGLSVKLDTNGSNPQMLRELLERKIVDYVAMDIKSPINRYNEITCSKIRPEDIEESIEIVKLFSEHEFRTTVIPVLNEKDLRVMGGLVSRSGKPRLYTLQQFRNTKTYDPEYSRMKPKSSKELERLRKIMQEFAFEVRILGD